MRVSPSLADIIAAKVGAAQHDEYAVAELLFCCTFATEFVARLRHGIFATNGACAPSQKWLW
jgi:hypothetical protein